ncbi:hypothetical protein [Novosphingobium sp. UBA1939]|uniref:hypothetical protein n=1 Tax=Novosphingobium sp. UBA1939 TaxID=1946982 RepID=UPI0025FEF890|nr:hypothetical protein [Novosphingobium sp. UBA1939]
MIRINPFRAEDALELVLQPTQLVALSWHDRQRAAHRFGEAGNAFTVRDACDRAIFCGGAIEQHAGYATLWGLFALDKRHASFRLLTATRRFIAGLPHRRVDATLEDRAEAKRWAWLLGLRPDAILTDAAPDGGDLQIWRRV